MNISKGKNMYCTIETLRNSRRVCHQKANKIGQICTVIYLVSQQ